MRRVSRTTNNKAGSISGTSARRPREEAPSAELKRVRAEAEAAMAEADRAHARLREAIELLPEGVVFIDAEGRYILWNKKYADIYKGSADLFKPGVKLEDTLRVGVARGDYPEAVGREEEWIKERLVKLYQPGGGRHEQLLADGRTIMIEEQITSDGGVIGVRVDITDMKKREESFRLLFEGNPVPMLLCDVDSDRILAVNESALIHYGYLREIFLTKTFRELQAFRSEVPWSQMEVDEEFGRTWKHVRADGALIDVAIYSRQAMFEGRRARLVAALDMTSRKLAEARLAYLADHDELTGLANRQVVRRHGDDMIRDMSKGRFAVALCIDIDKFRNVNEAFGHDIGDKFLRCVGLRLQSSLREKTLISRLGTDEFAVIDVGLTRIEDAESLATRLLSALSEPYLIEGHAITAGASIGISLGPQDGDNVETLLKNADLALMRAKEGERGTYTFFEAGMEALLQKRRRIEADLRTAIAGGALRPYYQPLINLASGQVSGYETLARWPHPERGMIPPAEFVPVAEETGLIGSLGTTILRRACLDAANWPNDARVAVNLSPLQFRSGNLLATVMNVLKESGLAPSRLELEITETLLLERSEEVIATLHALRALGVRVCMDDFGTGYSSLSYLRSFPFDKIKIDRSFIKGVDASPDARAIVRAIIGLGIGLGATVTAEGVETEAELAWLQAEGCHEAQGFLFSQARPNDEIVAAMKARQVA
jgi:diguanylate cyclase (GGDEF)-like protein/PAS domain S-box-containing protein